MFFGTLASSFDFSFLDKCLEIYANSNVRFVICGDGDHLSQLKKTYGSDIVQFTGWISKKQLGGLATVASIALAPYIRIDNFLTIYRTKLLII